MKPSLQLVLESFKYNPNSGILTWRKRPRNHFNACFAMTRCNNVYSGLEAGGIHFNKKGQKHYRRVKFLGSSIFTHHIAWAIQTGEWPKSIDHKDGNGLNNKWDNIIEASSLENMKNLRLYKNNKSGVPGVYKNGKRWRADIRHDNKLIHLGSFADKFDAICIRKSAEHQYGFSLNHGEPRPKY